MRSIEGTGTPGELVVVTYSDGTTDQATVNAAGKWVIYPGSNRPAGPITAKGSEQTNTSKGTLACLNCNPERSSTVVTWEGDGSVVNRVDVVDGVYNVEGSLPIQYRNVDYDILSPTYGDVDAYIPAGSSILATNSSGDILTLLFGQDNDLDLSFLPILATLTDPVSIFPFSSTVNVEAYDNGSFLGSFGGVVSGVFEEYDDGISKNRISFDFGHLKGTLIGNGVTTDPCPVPGPLPLLGVGAAFGSIRKLRKFSSQIKTFSMS